TGLRRLSALNLAGDYSAHAVLAVAVASPARTAGDGTPLANRGRLGSRTRRPRRISGCSSRHGDGNQNLPRLAVSVLLQPPSVARRGLWSDWDWRLDNRDAVLIGH